MYSSQFFLYSLIPHSLLPKIKDSSFKPHLNLYEKHINGYNTDTNDVGAK